MRESCGSLGCASWDATVLLTVRDAALFCFQRSIVTLADVYLLSIGGICMMTFYFEEIVICSCVEGLFSCAGNII